MSKTLVLQVNIKMQNTGKSKNTFSYHDELYSTSQKSLRAYAKRNGFDYTTISSDRRLPGYHPAFQRISLWHQDFKKYDNIIYADCDFIVHKLTPNIIEWTDKKSETFFACPDASAAPPLKWTNAFNSGFFVIKRELIEKLRDKYEKYLEKHVKSPYKDQDMLNDMMHKEYRGYCTLSKHWNGTFAIVSPLFSAHYVAMAKEGWTKAKHDKWENQKLEKLRALSKEDIIKRYTDHKDMGGRVKANR